MLKIDWSLGILAALWVPEFAMGQGRSVGSKGAGQALLLCLCQDMAALLGREHPFLRAVNPAPAVSAADMLPPAPVPAATGAPSASEGSHDRTKPRRKRSYVYANHLAEVHARQSKELSKAREGLKKHVDEAQEHMSGLSGEHKDNLESFKFFLPLLYLRQAWVLGKVLKMPECQVCCSLLRKLKKEPKMPNPIAICIRRVGSPPTTEPLCAARDLG